jgi:hypothetical protein
VKAVVYGGVQIGGITAQTATLFAGVYVEMRGTTLTQEGWKPAGCSIEMNPSEALDLAGELIRAAAAHSVQTQRQVSALVKRLAKKTPTS